MTPVELLFLPPLVLAVAIVVGASGRRRGAYGPSIRRAFVALLGGTVAVAVAVRVIVALFA